MSSDEHLEPAQYHSTSLESLSDAEASHLVQLQLRLIDGEWSLSLRDGFSTWWVEWPFSEHVEMPTLAEIQSVLDTRGLVFSDTDWSPWSGVAPDRYRSLRITTPEKIEGSRAEAAAKGPHIGGAERAWAIRLMVVGALTSVVAAVGADGTPYSLVRFLLCGISIALIVLAIRRDDVLPIVPLALATILWNPIIQARYPRSTWLVCDLVAAGGFIGLIIWNSRKRKVNVSDPTHGWDK